MEATDQNDTGVLTTAGPLRLHCFFKLSTGQLKPERNGKLGMAGRGRGTGRKGGYHEGGPHRTDSVVVVVTGVYYVHNVARSRSHHQSASASDASPLDALLSYSRSLYSRGR